MKNALGSIVCALLMTFAAAQIRLGGDTSPDGKQPVRIDLPVDQRLRNCGGADGAGMCVMSSIEMAARWCHLEELRGLRDWCARQPGGAYPAKVDRQLRDFCREKKIPVPDYIQYTGSDIDLLRKALATGRMPAVTYTGNDGVRYRGRIAHMVNLVQLNNDWAALLDNNGIGADELLWMTPEEFRRRFGIGWVFLWLAPPPPPVPHNG
ncbi:MAG: hypothetical protein KatS3mg105_4887 [Gemmatales bacterium]|nr:MAG: hypothetical protein KatS3mg105_4887 [Gemmatales bacterium]